jgi:hypothetical protein
LKIFQGPAALAVKKAVDKSKKLAYPTILVIENTNEQVDSTTLAFREASYNTPIRVFPATAGVAIMKQANEILRGTGTNSL